MSTIKRLRFGILFALLVGASLYPERVVSADCTFGTVSAYRSETITVSSTSIGFTAGMIDDSTGNRAQLALVTIAGDAVRWWADGAVPTASVGHPVAVGTNIEVCGFGNLRNFRMIRQTGDATVSVSYFR